jgi:hypothetical protein
MVNLSKNAYLVRRVVKSGFLLLDKCLGNNFRDVSFAILDLLDLKDLSLSVIVYEIPFRVVGIKVRKNCDSTEMLEPEFALLWISCLEVKSCSVPDELERKLIDFE